MIQLSEEKGFAPPAILVVGQVVGCGIY